MAKVLVIDDSSFQRKNLCKLLGNIGYQTVVAENGKEGLEMAEVEAPDCIITDLLMPVMSGTDFLRELRARATEIPIVVLSADIQESTRTECMSLGAVAFLTKPINRDELGATLERFVRAEAKEGI